MQHMLDNDPVEVGDKVYDLVFGTGEVSELKVDGRFRVRFATGAHVYDRTGIRVDANNRTLFWHNPVVTVPQKDDTHWSVARRLCEAMIAELKELL